MGLFNSFREKRRRHDAAASLYTAAVDQARYPIYFTDWGVPDSVDGRFDMIILHTMLLIRRMRGNGEEAAETCQSILNLLFADMDRNLREMGVGDLSVGKHVKRMAKAFYGRAETWEAGIDAGNAALRESLRETVYRTAAPTDDQVGALADYVSMQDEHLKGQGIPAFVAGTPAFARPESTNPAA